MDQLNLLSNEDKLELQSLEKNIARTITHRVSASPPVKFFKSLKDQNISKDLNTKIMKLLSQYEVQIYDDEAKGKIKSLFNSLTNKLSLNIQILSSDFEGLFDKSHPDLLKKARELYGESKVLQGYYLASNIPSNQIPEEISDLIKKTKEVKIITN